MAADSLISFEVSNPACNADEFLRIHKMTYTFWALSDMLQQHLSSYKIIWIFDGSATSKRVPELNFSTEDTPAWPQRVLFE